MTAALTLRDKISGAFIQRAAPLAERLVADNPDRYEVVEAIQPTAIPRTLPPSRQKYLLIGPALP